MSSLPVPNRRDLRQQQRKGKDDVGNDAGRSDNGAVGRRTVAQQIGVVFRIRAIGIVVRKTHIAAQWKEAKCVFDASSAFAVFSRVVTALCVPGNKKTRHALSQSTHPRALA